MVVVFNCHENLAPGSLVYAWPTRSLVLIGGHEVKTSQSDDLQSKQCQKMTETESKTAIFLSQDRNVFESLELGWSQEDPNTFTIEDVA